MTAPEKRKHPGFKVLSTTGDLFKITAFGGAKKEVVQQELPLFLSGFENQIYLTDRILNSIYKKIIGMFLRLIIFILFMLIPVLSSHAEDNYYVGRDEGGVCRGEGGVSVMRDA